MCGIAGVFKITGPVTAEDVTAVVRMLDAQVHRGPDDWGLLVPSAASREPADRSWLGRLDPAHVRTYPSVASAPALVLGARRLSIIDRSPLGRMPMGTETAERWIAFNGELVGQGREAAKQAVRDNDDLAVKIKTAILEKVGTKGGATVGSPEAE